MKLEDGRGPYGLKPENSKETGVVRERGKSKRTGRGISWNIHPEKREEKRKS